MILMAATCIKVLLPLLAGFLFWKQFQNTLSVKCRVGLAALCVLFACIANMAAGYVPPLTDTVTLTALGETGQAGKGQEVFVTGYTVDGETYGPQNAVEGKWFWIGERYGWRPETDRRQPEGTTRSVTLEVPVGWERRVNFSVNEWRGKVEVTGIHGTQQVDTSVTGIVSIDRSNSIMLIQNQILSILVYTIIFLFLGALVTVFWRRYTRNPDDTKKFVIAHWEIWTYGGIALISLVFMIRYSGIKSFWYDEMYQVAFSGLATSPVDAIFRYYSTTPPLYTMLMQAWYHLVPYGEGWLRLLSEIFTCFSVFFIGLCGRDLRNKRTGLIAALLSAGSPTVILLCGYENRTYGLMLLLTSLLLWLYIRQLRGIQSHSAAIFFVMLLLAYTHYFGVFLCGALFLIDCYLRMTKRVGNKVFVPYLLVALCYLPWIFYMYLQSTFDMKATWQPRPSLAGVIGVLKYITGDMEIVYTLFLVGAAVIVAKTLCHRWSYKTLPIGTFAEEMPLLLIAIMIFCLYIYGRFISPDATLWVERYFTNILPCAVLVGAQGVDECCTWLEGVQRTRSNAVEIAIVLFVLFSVIPAGAQQIIEKVDTVYQPYREAADWIYEHGNIIYSPDTIVINSGPSAVVEGWNEYYMTEQGRRDVLNLRSQYQVDEQELDQYQHVITVSLHVSFEKRPWFQELQEVYHIIDQQNNYKVTIYQRNLQE